MSILSKLVDVLTTGPDSARRRKVLNLLLLVALIGLLAAVIIAGTGWGSAARNIPLLILGVLAVLVGAGAIFTLSRALEHALANLHTVNRELDRRIIECTRELAEVDRVKSVFVSLASHELRTPLNAIMGYSEMLRKNVYGPLSDQQRGVLERVIANAGQLLSLANNLLDRAQLEAGELTLNVVPFAPAELITGVQGVMDVIAQAKGLQLTSHISSDVPAMLSGDEQRLHEVLVNLVGNATKFTDEGTVCMRAYSPDVAHWALEVTDTGCGIPQEAQSYIFEPFRQADESVTREYGGAGVGLSIVKQLVDLMGGEIRVESEVGRGSTFTIILPLVLSKAEGLVRSQEDEPIQT